MVNRETSTFSIGNRDPVQQERLAQWDAISTELNRAGERTYDRELDPGINDVAVGINALLGGYYTTSSCEGHNEGVSVTFPWVYFNCLEDSKVDGLDGLLDEFYVERNTDEAVQLHIYDGVGGAMYALEAELQRNYFDKNDSEVSHSDNVRSLEAQQREVTDFVAFLKDKFLAGYQIPTAAKEIHDEVSLDETNEEDVDYSADSEHPEYWSFDISLTLSALKQDGKPFFDQETVGELAELDFCVAFETAYGYLTQAGLDADGILAPWIDNSSEVEISP